jgi:signal transduction histidine kinase
LTLAVSAFGALATLGVIFLPGVRFAYRNPRLHIAIDTADAVIALLVAFLLFGRFSRSNLLRDLLLTQALLVFGLGNLFLSAIPTTMTGVRVEDLTTWGTLTTRAVGGVLMVGASFVGSRPARTTGRFALLTSAGIVAVAGVTITVLSDILPQAIDMTAPADPTQPALDGHVAVMVLHFVLMAMFAVVAVRFTAFADQQDDELMRWFGAGAALAAFARLNYLLYPSLYSEYVYTGDGFRLGFYLLLLIGAGREIASYWSGLAETAVTEERRRMARDLHDGLAQELAFMWSDIQGLKRAHPNDDKVARASGSAERALDESRRAIAAFTRSPNEPLDIAISTSIEEVARRLRTRVRLDLASDIHVSPKLREDLLRVVREAVTNAARHGGAETIEVRLWAEGGLCLEISDDGVGFDPQRPPRTESFGIISMRERVTNHGGRLDIHSIPGGGTQVKVVLP